jgi:hypothetical protein
MQRHPYVQRCVDMGYEWFHPGIVHQLRAKLAPVTRAPHLSGLALSCQALSSRPEQLLLNAYAPQLKLLATHKLGTNGAPVSAAVLDLMQDAPASWRLPPRQLSQVPVGADGVQQVVRLTVESIAAACRGSFAGNKVVPLLESKKSVPATMWGPLRWQAWHGHAGQHASRCSAMV